MILNLLTVPNVLSYELKTLYSKEENSVGWLYISTLILFQEEKCAQLHQNFKEFCLNVLSYTRSANISSFRQLFFDLVIFLQGINFFSFFFSFFPPD